MAHDVNQALAFAEARRSRFIDQLGAFVSIPSVSTEPERREDMRRAAAWLADCLQEIGLENVQIFPPDSHPLVYGEYLSAGARAPTILVYGHYDVQPAEPLEKWNTDPFSPIVRGDQLFGRGTSDMKGNVLGTIFAVEAWLKNGGLPVNVKFLIEGQEEIGSPSITAFLQEQKALLAADFCLNPDAGMLSPDQPTITYALRGLSYFELHVFGPENDLHSGLYGGAIHNPAQALVELTSGMHLPDGRVNLPGFYDGVRELTGEERQELARLPVSEQDLQRRTGVPAIWGEKDYTFFERITARPTLEINGLLSGFTGQGAKTVIPAQAMAKISCRLVPDQDPDKIKASLETYLERSAPETIRWELRELTRGYPSISDIHSPWIRAMVQAQTQAFGAPPLFRREGGSIPVVADLQHILGIESINVGIGLPDDNQHGPNEKMHLPSFHRQIDSFIRFFHLAGEASASQGAGSE